MIRSKNYILSETIAAIIFSLCIIIYFIISILSKINNGDMLRNLFILLIILSWVIRDNLRILSDPDKMREIFDERNILIDLKATKIAVFALRWSYILMYIFNILNTTAIYLLIDLLLIESIVVYKLAYIYFDKRN